MKYIFVAGAPGSKWSSVVKNIYYSPDVDRSDYRDSRTYYHDASGKMQLMHLGAYFDPGMECDLPEDLTMLDKSEAEKIFDRPFSSKSQRVRIIKSHIFSYKKNMEFLKQHWPDSPCVLVYRSDDSCLGWWVKCGHFNITYPDYHPYYKNLKTMDQLIQRQNRGILESWEQTGTRATGNIELCKLLGIEFPGQSYCQVYQEHDIFVKVI